MMVNKTFKIKLIECPRDAMQGWKHFIPTQKKISYINALLKVGFDTIDVGSFVSPKAIPQMADTAEVIMGLQVDQVATKLLVISLSSLRPFLDFAENNTTSCCEEAISDKIRFTSVQPGASCRPPKSRNSHSSGSC